MANKTPVRNKTLSGETQSTFSPQFSPVAASPVRSPASQGNLTGVPRKVKDSCATCYNITEKWKNLNTQGYGIINSIANIKLNAIYKASSAEKPSSQTDMPQELEPLIEEMENIHMEMSKLVEKLEGVSSSLQGLAAMETADPHNESTSQEALFSTWPITLFGQKCSEVAATYKRELGLKKNLISEIAHVTNRETIMLYTETWQQQVYVGDETVLSIESMLQETGHR